MVETTTFASLFSLSKFSETQNQRRYCVPRQSSSSPKMGSQMSSASRRSSSSSYHPQPPSHSAARPARTMSAPTLNSNSNPNSNVNSGSEIGPSEADLRSYEAASRSDPDLRSFDSTLQLRTSRAISSVAGGLETRSLSLGSLREVTESLLEMNEEAVKIFLQDKEHIWKNRELADLVDDYFENSLLTLDFCTTLDSCLKRAGHIESIINIALRKFEEEHNAVPGEGSVKNYSRTLEELKAFRATEDPFSQEFFRVFSSIYSKQIQLLEKLQAKKRKLDKKLGKMKAWKKASYVIFIATFASILICSVVAAALHASPVVAAVAAAAAVPLGSIGRWLNSLWKKYEKELRGQRELVSSMQFGAYCVIKDLDSIRVLVDRFQLEIEALLANADFATREEEEAVVIAMEEIRKKVDDFVKIIHELSEHANRCTQKTRMARTVILRKIINHPGS